MNSTDKKDICLVEEKKKFLFWKWICRYYKHEWAYSDELPKLKRKC
jgi:hypothetical protein